ncbi:protein FMP32, mitochondrial [Selaginella moellendorffii]|uniref:protein FMP32, mitochondrial n=1 Tax=Selaginella moellendorffii TaxID=88036 RepID=UPI000D1CC6B1|nr:protein FMP32, mitochondrial [Selaginella moellendorffii]|eukprot:XP_024528433.1 protein FMP32, mitochondrial [Selaginella moellendorffii]
MAWAVRKSGVRSLNKIYANWDNARGFQPLGELRNRLENGSSRNYYRTNSSNQLVVQPSYNGKRAFLVDTLQLVRRLEKQGLTDNQAEAITAVITEVLNDSLENVAQSFVSKPEMQRKELMQEAVLSKLRAEIVSQLEHHVSTSQRESERLRTDLDKLKSELKYEIDKVTAGQRLDLNLEKGRIRDVLANQSTETANLTNKLDSEIHTLKTQLEVAKYDVIKYCIGSIVSVTAVGLGLLRIMM